MRTLAALFAAAVAAAAGGPVAAGQEPADRSPAVFRAGTDLIQVDVSVLDGRRQPVTGLTAADFTVLEDGQPRPVEAFTVIELPDRITATDAAWTRDVPQDVASNQMGEQEGRLVVILMDRSIPLGQPTITARQIAAAAVQSLGPGDLAALVSTGGGAPQNLTSDRERLMRAINQRDWSTGVSAEAEEVMPEQMPGLFTAMTDGRCLCGLCSQQAVTRIATALQDLPRRRKSVLFIGSSFVVQDGMEMGAVENPAAQQSEMGCALKLKDSRREMFEALDRSGVTIHSVDPSGLNTVGPISQASSTLRAGRVGAARTAAVQEHQQNQDNLRILPDRTGGRVVVNTNGPQDQVPQIFRESQSYYLIGFHPADPGPSARPVRSIEVKVNRRGVNVHARRQYVVPGAASAAGTVSPAAEASSTPPPPSAGALSGLLPDSRLPLDLNVAAFADPEGSARAVVAITVGLDAFAPAGLLAEASPGPPASSPASLAAPAVAVGRRPDPAGGPAPAPAPGAATIVTPIEIVAAAFDQSGRPRASARQTLELSWPPAESPRPDRIEVLSRLDLEPGDYEIRVAASTTDQARTASIFTQLVVPSFGGVPFSLSNIVMRAGAATSTAPREFLGAVLPVVPTTQRAFARAEGATAFVRVYQGTGRADALEPVHVRVRIIDARDRIARDEALVLPAAGFGSNRAADAHLVLPLASLASGEYLLSLEATMGERVAGRALRFSVR